MPDVGYYTLPVILSFEGIDSKVNKDLSKKLGAAGKKGGKDFGEGVAGGVADGMKAAEQAVERSTKKIVQLKDKVANASDAARLAEQKYQEAVEKGVKGSRLTAASNAREKALRAEKAATRDLTAETRQLERAQKSLADGAGMDDAGDSAGSSFLDGFGGAIAALGTKAGPIGMAITAAAGVALAGGAIIGKQIMAGLEIKQSEANIQAKLGLSEEAMAPIAAAAGKAYAGNFGESVAANMDAARAAIQGGLLSPGAGTEATQQMISQLDTVSQVLGEEIPAVTRAAGQAIRTGLADNATEAFDLIIKGQQAGLNTSEDLLDTLNEYGTQFRKLGLDGPEAIGLMSQAMKAGARDSDVAADALKEFSIRAVDGSKTTVAGFEAIGLNADDMAARFSQGGAVARDALGEVLTRLRQMPPSSEKAVTAFNLFGTQSEDLGAALDHMDLGNAVEQLGEVEGATKRAADTMGGTGASAVESARRSIELAADSMQENLADAFGPQLTKLATWVSEHGPQIEGFFAGLGQVAVVAAGSIASFVAETTGGLALVVNAVGDTFGAIATVQAKFAELMGDEEKAASFREQAEAGFGLADSLYAVRDGAAATRDGMREAYQTFGQTKEQAAQAAEQVGRIASQLQAMPGSKQIDISAIVTYKDQNGLVIPPEQLRAPVRAPAVPGDTYRGPGRAFGGPITGPGGPKSDIIPIWASNGEHMWTADEVNAVGGQQAMYRLRGMAKMGMFKGFAEGGAIDDAISLAQSMDGLPYIYGSRDCSKVQSDVYAALMGKPAGTRYFTTESDFESLGFVKGYKEGAYNIGVKRGGGGKLSHMAGTLPNGVRFEAGGADSTVKYGGDASGAEDFPLQWYLPVTGGDPTSAGGGSYSLLDRASGGSGFGGGSGGSSGTPGYGPNGESGTYSVDESEVADAQSRVAEAEAKVREAEAKQRELEADAKESERISAQADVDKAKADKTKAERELEEAKRGKFTPGDTSSSSSPSSSSGQGGLGQFGELGNIAGSFLKETFGVDGSFLPDISNLMPVQMAGTLLNAFAGPLQGLVDGQLGIQQPGWQPGMPVNGQTSGGVFGMPDVAAPPMPAPGVHGGSGMAPGPTIIQNVDQSQQFHNSPVGWDPARVNQERDRNQQMRTLPRIPAGF